MERIKQAIKKAKDQQSNLAPYHDHSRHDNMAGKFSFSAWRNHDSLEEISYTSTRVVNLNLEHLENNRIVAFNKNDPNSMMFDILRTNILQKMEENGWRTLAITSPTPESGKSVVAINLAMSIAQLTNRSALLVDFDLRRPKVATYLGLNFDKSLNDILEGNAELSDVLINPNIPRLTVLATNNPVKNSSETLTSKKITNLIKDVRERYESRIIIFDLPPLLVITDALALLPQVDCVLLVVANGKNTKQEIQDSLRQLSSAKLIGTVLNMAEIGSRTDHYY